MALTVWTNGGGDQDWETVGNWSNGVPSDGDTAIMGPTATAGPLLNVDRRAENTNQGLDLAKFEVAVGATYDIGSSASPLYFTADTHIKHEGSGTLYMNPEGGSLRTPGADETTLFIVESPNVQDAATIGGGGYVLRYDIIRGRAVISNTCDNGNTNQLFIAAAEDALVQPSVQVTTTSFEAIDTIVLSGQLNTSGRHKRLNMHGGRIINQGDMGGGGFGESTLFMSGGLYDHRQDGTENFGNTLKVYAAGGTVDTSQIANASLDELYLAPSATLIEGSGLVILKHTLGVD